MDKSELISIGVLSKLHGYKGAYQFYSERTIDDDIENRESVFLEIQGLLVPFFIESINVTSDNTAVIKFEDIDNPETAKEFVSCNVFVLSKGKASKPSKKKKEEDFKGFAVIDKTQGNIGAVNDILNYNQNILLSVMKDGNEILIPVSEEIIQAIDHKKKEILIDAPEGLLDLN
ncbi:MAG TPA: ribosome maturation factor RimM [Bacteroidales bacterium]|nr:ribosome maturation factor RimM [Bacteroidales bacterium]